MEEKVFLDSPFGNVSTSKIVIAGSTYATRNVGSVRVERIGRPSWPWLILIIGVVIILANLQNPGFGIIVAGVGAIAAWVIGPRAKLHLLAGGGEKMALESKNIAAVESLHQAIVEAISAR